MSAMGFAIRYSAAMDIKDKHMVVTGGASGIGRALCQRFAADGARAVVVADLDGERAQAVAEEIGGLAVTVDVGDEDQNKALVASAEEANGPIDLFCANAGIATTGGMEVANDAWQRIWEINVMAHVYAARAVLPGMIARGDGYFLTTASAAGLLSQVGSAPYAVTKHAAVALAEWLAISHGDQGIKVSVLCPQGVRTAMLEDAASAGDGRLAKAASLDGVLEPEQVAEEVVKAIAEERFLILPHPKVLEYIRQKTGDYERWIGGMRRLHARFAGPDGATE